MYDFKTIQIPVVACKKLHLSWNVECNAAFRSTFTGDRTDSALSVVKNFIELNIQSNTALPYASHLFINDCNYICIHFKAALDNTHFVILAQLAIDNEFMSNIGNDVSEMFNYLQKNFASIIGALHNDLVMTDKNGQIQVVLPSFEDFYGIPASKALNKTVYELEEAKVLSPSVIANVLRTGHEDCILQRTLSGKYLMAYAKPIFNSAGEVENVISYSRDLTQYELLKRQYEYLNQTILSYSAKIAENNDSNHMCNDIIGYSKEISVIKSMLHTYAKFDANVLLTGESGVGKTLYAKILHNQSERRNQPFVNINCGAISDNLFESEFFGYEKGAFTGANNEGKKGFVEAANGGTLFLDEIADLPKPMQVKLLKLLDTRTITRVGGVKEIPVDFRFIAATNKNIPELIEKGEFREDLYFRINLLPLEIPPLRNHPNDIPTLTNYFAEECLKKYNTTKMFSTKAKSALMEYPWPGNIRELKNVIERLCLVTNSETIDYADLPDYIIKHSTINVDIEKSNLTLPEMLASVEKNILLKAYQKYGNTTKVAKALGISQPSVSIKLKKYNIEKADEKADN